MQDIWTRLKEWWLNAPRALKIGLVGGAVGFVVLLAVLGLWAGAPQYQVLYSELSPADAATVVARLKEKGIPVRTSGNGTIVEIPTSALEEARLDLASQGLPKTGAPGYTRLDKSSFGMTQSMEQNTLRIALEEELQNTIQHLEPVESARVHLTPGNDSPFADSKLEPTASVVLQLKPDSMLTRDQVRGVVHLVSRSVEGLKPESVSVLDQDARPLWKGGDTIAEDSDLVRVRREAERAYAEDLRRTIQNQLDSVLGTNKSSVIVQAELNLDKEEVQAQKVEPLDPKRSSVVSETISTEQMKGTGSIERGAAGIASNNADVPTYGAMPPGEVAPGEYVRDDRVRNYEVNKQITHSVRAPGRIERLSVAVLIDEEIPEKTVTALQNWIKTTIVATPDTPARQVTVQRVAFDKSREQQREQERKQVEQARRWQDLWKLLPVFLLIAVAFFVARVLGKQIAKRTLPAPQALAAITAGDGSTFSVSVGDNGVMATQEGRRGVEREPWESGIEDEEGNLLLPAIRSATQGVHSIAEQKDPELAAIARFSLEKPDRVANLIKSWLKS